MGKQNMFDHSMRVPLVIAGPGIPRNRRFSQQVYLQDAAATILDLAGIEKNEGMEFNSLIPCISAGPAAKSAYSAVYGCYRDLQRMVRTDRYKLIVYPKANKVLLFDMENDPYEMHDLAENPEFGGIRSDLIKELEKLQRQYHDPLKLSLK